MQQWSNCAPREGACARQEAKSLGAHLSHHIRFPEWHAFESQHLTDVASDGNGMVNPQAEGLGSSPKIPCHSLDPPSFMQCCPQGAEIGHQPECISAGQCHV